MTKRFQAALAALLLAGAAVQAHAQAQPSVVVYGLVDLAVEHLGDVGDNGRTVTRMPQLTGNLPSRLGLRGSEDLGGGLRAIFTLEQGLALDLGTLNQGGRGWGRQSWVGLAGPWGTLTFGRVYTMLFWSILDADVMGPSLYGSGSLDAYIPNARADNALAYRGTFGGLTLGATYSLGRDAVNAGPSPAGTNCAGEGAVNSKDCTEWSAMLKYDSARWGAAAAVDEIRGGPGAFAGLTSGDLSDRRVSLNGYFKFGDLRLTAGLIRRDNEASTATPRSDLQYAGVVYAFTPLLVLEAEWLRLAFKGSANRATLLAAKLNYSLSKRTTVYATAGGIDNQGALAISVSAGQAGGNPVAGASQTAFAAGIRHAF